MIQVRLTSARINLLHVVIQQPKTAYKVRSTAPALAVCHPGASYNPTFEDHQVGTSCHLGYRVFMIKKWVLTNVTYMKMRLYNKRDILSRRLYRPQIWEK